MAVGIRGWAILFFLLFVVAAAVQWNDPDPLVWILTYATGAALSLAAAIGHPLPRVTGAAGLVFGLAFVSSAASLVDAPTAAFTSFGMRAPVHEAPREAAGLGLLCAWTVFLAWRTRPRA
jgi:hypothetical protein